MVDKALRSKYHGKKATPLQADFTKWIVSNVGVKLEGDEAEAFRDGVRLAMALNATFRGSDDNAERRLAAAKEKAEKAAATAEKLENLLKRRGKVSVVEDEPEDEDETEEDEEPEDEEAEEDEDEEAEEVKPSKKNKGKRSPY